MDITVGPNDTSVEIGAVGHGKAVSHTVIPGKTNTLPVPPLPPGTVLSVRAGKGLRMRVVYVEIIALDP
jgi:hypothetical protein